MMSTQSSNNSKRIANNTLVPHALYDGGVAVHEPSHMECVGSFEDLGIYNVACGVVSI